MAHLRAVPDPDDVPEDVAEVDPVVEPVDPAAATAPGEDGPPHEDVHDEAFEEVVEEAPRRYPSTIGGAFYLSILAVAGTRLSWIVGVARGPVPPKACSEPKRALSPCAQRTSPVFKS